VGKIAKKKSLKEYVFVNLALKIQCLKQVRPIFLFDSRCFQSFIETTAKSELGAPTGRLLLLTHEDIIFLRNLLKSIRVQPILTVSL